MSESTPINHIPLVRKLYNLGESRHTPAKTIMGIYKAEKTRNTKIFIFSDNASYNNGKILANYIKKHKLGDIAETGKTRNPNNRNIIQTWMWSVYRKGLENWATKQDQENYTPHH